MSAQQTNDLEHLARLAARLTERGTRPWRAGIRTHHADKSWFDAAEYVRDWRFVAYRWLRRYLGGEWHIGGHHVGRLHFGPAIGDMRRVRGDRRPTRLIVDGAPAFLEVIR